MIQKEKSFINSVQDAVQRWTKNRRRDKIAYKKIYKITVKADDEKQLPTEYEIEFSLNRIPSDYKYHIDSEEVRDCENCMCAGTDIYHGRIYCHFQHRFRESGVACNWWHQKEN